jgi:tetratricopeptide (TPR) repeat protein
MRKNYDEIYKQAEYASLVKKNKLLDTIIREKPYFHDPRIYFMKIECLMNFLIKKRITKQKYNKEIKKYVPNFFISYYINRDYVLNHMNRKDYVYMAAMIIEEYYDTFLIDEFKWQAVGFLNDIVETLGIKDKSSYRQGDELIHHSLQELWNIYTLYNYDEELTKQTQELMYAYKGHCYINWGEETSKTIDLFKKSLAINSENTLALYGLGVVCYESEEHKNISKAVRCLLKAAENEFDEWRCYYLLAKIYVGKNKKKEALKYYERAIELYDEDDMRKFLLDIHEDLGYMSDKLNLHSALQQSFEASQQLVKPKLDFQANVNLKELPINVFNDCKKATVLTIEALLGSYYEILEENCKKSLEQVETIYSLAQIHDAYMKEALAANYRNYYSIVEHEMNCKIFNKFKSIFYKKHFAYTFDLKTKEPFTVYMKERDWKLTIGQIIKIFKNSSQPDSSKHYREFNNYLKYYFADLLDPSFMDRLIKLNNANNNIKHQGNIRQLSYRDDFIYFRELVMGNTRHGGILHAVLKSFTDTSTK